MLGVGHKIIGKPKLRVLAKHADVYIRLGEVESLVFPGLSCDIFGHLKTQSPKLKVVRQDHNRVESLPMSIWGIAFP